MKFLGGVEATRLDAIAEALKGAAVRCRPFELSVSGLGAFPTPARARVLWAGIEAGAAEATALARHVDDALVPLGFEREARAFSAHVTLGRVRTPRSNPQVAPALTGARDFGRQRVEQLALMRSELSPRGARYTELAITPLSTGSPE